MQTPYPNGNSFSSVLHARLLVLITLTLLPRLCGLVPPRPISDSGEPNDDDGNSMSLNLLNLPIETLIHILSFLNPSSLSALMRVNAHLRDVSERILYTDVSIIDSVNFEPHDIVTPHRTLICCSVVSTRPYLSQCIRRLSIRWTRDRARRDGCRLAPYVTGALRALLQSANQIEALELHLAGLPPVYNFALLLEGTTFRLHRLALGGPQEDAHVDSVLKAQRGLTYLHLPDTHGQISLSPDDLPLLETFRGDIRCAVSIIPGRPVNALILSRYEPTGQLLSRLAYGRQPVRKLDLSALSITPTQLLTISKHLTALETLRMRLALRHTLHFTFSGMMLLSALTQVLGAFTRLKNLDLSPTSVDGVITNHNERDERALCVSWSGVAPSLRRVKFPSGIEWERITTDNDGDDFMDNASRIDAWRRIEERQQM